MFKFGLHKQMVQIPTSVAVDYELDFDLLQKAFDIEVQRNDSLRNRFKKVKGKVKQYFIYYRNSVIHTNKISVAIPINMDKHKHDANRPHKVHHLCQSP